MIRRHLYPALAIAIAMFSFSGPATAGQTFGWIEEAVIMPLDLTIKAKLDTGALTSSMHAEDIERFERDGEDWVSFTVELEDEESGDRVSERIERPLFRILTVSGAGGEDKRPVVLMKICLGSTIYEEQFSLRDRDEMLYPLLLGRRTIQHLGPVDVRETFLHEPDCDDDSPVRRYEDQENDEDIGID